MRGARLTTFVARTHLAVSASAHEYSQWLAETVPSESTLISTPQVFGSSSVPSFPFHARCLAIDIEQHGYLPPAYEASTLRSVGARTFML